MRAVAGGGAAVPAAVAATGDVEAPPATATTAPPPPPAAPPPAPPPPAPVRSVTEQAWTPMATAGPVTLLHPALRVERVGFHESTHEGAQQVDPAPTAASPTTLESRERGTSHRSAIDVVVDPGVEIRAPVTGRVKRAGTYVLYCDYSDDFAVIEPDDRPGWEVKLLHIDGVRVRRGMRVVAGETVMARRATQLPFQSQVDEIAPVQPAWPHVHIEVVDLAIPNVPSPGGGCK
ncbi:MAG TPA: hypothetical protein VM264_07575 [Acidimicrobiales bacterium]|nr:hypothetical protein [Acidimicrobiales bacterium]